MQQPSALQFRAQIVPWPGTTSRWFVRLRGFSQIWHRSSAENTLLTARRYRCRYFLEGKPPSRFATRAAYSWVDFAPQCAMNRGAHQWRDLFPILIDGLDHVLGQRVDVREFPGRTRSTLHVELVAKTATGFVSDFAGACLLGSEDARRRICTRLICNASQCHTSARTISIRLRIMSASC